MTIVLIAHSEIATVNDPRVASYTSYQLRLHKRARALVEDSADLIGFLATDVIIKNEQGGFGKTRARADGGSTRWLHTRRAAGIHRQEQIRNAGAHRDPATLRFPEHAWQVLPAAAGGRDHCCGIQTKTMEKAQ